MTIVPLGGVLSSAVLGMQNSMRQLDRAAGRIARSGLADASVPSARTGDGSTPPASVDDTADLAAAMITLLLAQRAFLADVRLAETAVETMRAAAELGAGRSERTDTGV